jgi:Spy/CpxP family protein refolding chaperone
MIYRMHRLLTADQRAKMNALHERWEQERRQVRRQPAK